LIFTEELKFSLKIKYYKLTTTTTTIYNILKKKVKKLVCLCNLVDEKEIISFLKKGANSTGEIQQLTRAGTSCGKCLPIIDGIVERYKKEKPKDQQKKLDFGL